MHQHRRCRLPPLVQHLLLPYPCHLTPLDKQVHLGQIPIPTLPTPPIFALNKLSNPSNGAQTTHTTKSTKTTKIWDGATRVYVPVFTSKDYSSKALAVRFRQYSDGPEVDWPRRVPQVPPARCFTCCVQLFSGTRLGEWARICFILYM